MSFNAVTASELGLSDSAVVRRDGCATHRLSTSIARRDHKRSETGEAQGRRGS